MSSNWDDLERWLERQELPKGMDILKEPDWVERFVRNMMTKSLPEAAGAIKLGQSAEIGTSKEWVTVKWKLPADMDRSRLKLLVREKDLRIGDARGGNGKKHVIKLPCLVRPRYCRAFVENGILHVKLRRRMGSSASYEHGVDWR